MKTVLHLLAVLALALTLTACARAHKITFTDGRTLTVSKEPRLDEASGFYEYRNVTGELVRVNKDEIEKIEEVR